MGDQSHVWDYELQRQKSFKKWRNILPALSAENLAAQGSYYTGKREKQRKSYSKEGDQSNKEIDEEGEDKSFWSEKTENTPEARIEIANHIRKSKESKNITEETRQKRVIRLFNKDGIPLNVNEAKIDFRFRDDDFNFYVLELHTYKHLDISFIDIDVQPFYIKVLIKGKVFQLTFDEEIKIAEASAKRSQTSGHLVITMPKMNREVKLLKPKPDPLEFLKESSENNTHSARREYLEIGSSQKDTYLDYTKICKQDDYTLKPLKPSRENVMEEKIPSADFTDNPEVPPLM